jgi:hypothetical protein
MINKNMTEKKLQLILIIFITLFSTTQIAAKKFTLVIEPTYPINQAKEIYEPFRNWLSKETGNELELVIDKNYYTYWYKAQKDELPDFTLDAPHIAAYRINYKNFTAVATTIEPLSFHLISLDEPAKDESVQDFMVGKKIVMLPSPSLATVYFKQWFTDLFAAPMKDITALSWQESVEIVFDDGAQAAIVPNWMFNLYPNFSSLLESKKTPGVTFTASPNVPKEIVDKFRSVLLSMKDNDTAYNVLVELNTEGFKQPNLVDYEGLTDLLPIR